MPDACRGGARPGRNSQLVECARRHVVEISESCESLGFVLVEGLRVKICLSAEVRDKYSLNLISKGQ